ncbi:MAG: TonB-dependent receptor [Pseudomonadota bacterium]
MRSIKTSRGGRYGSSGPWQRWMVGSAATLIAATALGADATTPGADDSLAEVTVTGSLIKSANEVAASPIVTISEDNLRESGAVTLEAALNQLPQFSTTSGAGSGGQGTGGHVSINLRGLGSNRNLVLLDGRRLPLADISGNVDINLLPDSIIASIDTITGGASAIYGSDAMSGVVNFLTPKYFDGIRGDLQYGDTFKNDLQKKAVSLALGSSFGADKGHVMLALGYTKREGMQGARRSFFDLVTPSSFIGTGTFVPAATNLPNQAAVNALFTGYGAATPVSNTLSLGFNDNGSLFTQTGAKHYLGPTGGAYAVIGGNVRMPVGPQGIIQNPLDRKSAFSKFEYEFSPTLTVYGQTMYVDSLVSTESGGSLTQFGALTTIPVTNPFIPADLRTLLATRPSPNASFTWNGRYVGIPDKAWDEQYKTSQFLLGARGDLNVGDWTWDVFASHDSTDHLQSNYNAVLKSRVQTLLNAAGGGNALCAGGFNPFGIVNATRVSQACIDYMTTTANSTEALAQDNLQGVVQGSLFSLPAGEVQAAVLADYRSNSYDYRPDTALAAQDIEAVIAAKPSRGSIRATEYAAQLEVPLLSDLPFIKRLSLGTAYRYSDYSTTGGVSSYEADLKWTPSDGFLIRAGYQRAVRAPNIGELFSASTGVQVAFGTPPGSIGDPCDVRSTARTGSSGASVRSLCLAQGIPASIIDTYTFPTTATAGEQHGNASLSPESADTFNVGFSWNSQAQSALLSDLTMSVDYYNIAITEVISVVPGLTTLSKCYNLDGSNSTYAASNTFCQLLHRDSNGQLQLIETPFLNLGGLRTNGVDVQLGWRAALADLGMHSLPGKLFVNTGVGWTDAYDVQTLPNTPYQKFGNTITVGAPHPKWKALTSVGYQGEALTVGLRWRFLGAMRDVTSVTTPATPQPGTPAYNIYDLYGTYDIGERLQVRAGVTNLADKLSVLVSSSQNSTDISTYDPVGRQYYVGLRFSL